jgi:hypothetical protein
MSLPRMKYTIVPTATGTELTQSSQANPVTNPTSSNESNARPRTPCFY